MNYYKKNISHRKIIHLKIRKKIFGTKEKPRICIYKSNTALIAQIINDSEGKTLVFAKINQKKMKNVKELAKIISTGAKKMKIKNVVFDRSGYLYHGKVKLFADECRKFGLNF